MLNKRQIGQYYEELACRSLCSKGLIFIAKNSQSRLGEIDLIMQDQSCLVFVEVRYRKNDLFGNAVSTITQAKQIKIIRAAYDWMSLQHINSESYEFRFDIFAFTGRETQWIKNAFSI